MNIPRNTMTKRVLLAAAGVLLLLPACGGEGPGGSSPSASTNPAAQPAITASGTEGSLGPDLGAPPPDEVVPQRVVQAVAGRAFVCALDEAGAVFCWGDRGPHWEGELSGGRFPQHPVHVTGAPPLSTLLVPVRLSDGSAPGVFDGACGLDESARWWCWGRHPSRPTRDQPALLDAKLVDDAGEPFIPDIPDGVLSILDPLAGFASLARRTCGAHKDGGLVCWPGVLSEGFDHVDGFPAGTRLAGECALTPDGAVQCSVPHATGPQCELDLTSLQAMGSRGCGKRADGEWRCFGRPIGSGAVVLPGLRDVVMPACE